MGAVIFEYRSYGTGDVSKVSFESFEIYRILFIAFRVKLLLKTTSGELVCDYQSFSFKMDEIYIKIVCPNSILHGRNALLGNISSS